jgi:NADP-dependent aldehyde dehydrogenase
VTTVVHETDETALEGVLSAAAEAAGGLADTPAAFRAAALRTVAEALDAAVDELVELADAETSLGRPRLVGEVARTTGQLRMFADGLEEGSWRDVVIDTADPHAQPVPRPDLRRTQVAVGPVLVFAAGNFPFAFSVAGGDTASALAAGCPVVLKGHPGHPRTTERTAEIVGGALAEAGMPAGSFGFVHGVEAGVRALRDPRISAASFTGSMHGGRALWDIAASRDVPIPFFAEMGSLNPVFVSRGAP